MKKNKLLKTGALALGTVASIAAPIAAVVSCGSGEPTPVLDFSTSDKAAAAVAQLKTLKTGTFDIKTPTTIIHVVNGNISDEEFDKISSVLPSSVDKAAIKAAAIAANERGKAAKSRHGLRYNTAVRSEIQLHTTFSATGPQFGTLKAIVDKYNSSQQATPGFKKVKLVHVEGGYGTIPSELQMKFGAHSNEIPNMFIDYADAAGYLSHQEMELDLTGSEGQLNDKVLKPMNDAIAGSKGETSILPISQSAEMISVDAPLLKFLITSAGGKLDTSPDTYTAKIAANTSTDFNTTGGNGWSEAKVKTLDTKTITDKDFASYDKLFELAGNIAKSQGLTKEATLRVLGLDAAVNTLYEIAYSKAKGDDSKFLYAPNSNGEYLDYNLFDGKDATSLFKNAAAPIANAIMNHSTKIYGGGAYSSSDETHHQLAMAVGSTAGYSHNFIDSAKELPSIDNAHTFDGDSIKFDASTKAITFGSYNNKIVTTKTGNYDVVISAASLTAAQAFAAKDTAHTYFVKGNEKPKGSTSNNTLELKGADGKTTKGFLVIALNKVNPAATTLQESELVVMPAPTSATENGTKVAFLQGPGIIGVHNNDSDDAATKLFTKWFTAKKQVTGLTIPHVTKTSYESPLAAWAAGSEYAVSLNGNVTLGEQKDLTGNKYVKGNYFVSKVLDGINAKETDSNFLHLLSPGADEDSSALRTYLDSDLRAKYDASITGVTVGAENIYNDFKQAALNGKIIRY